MSKKIAQKGLKMRYWNFELAFFGSNMTEKFDSKFLMPAWLAIQEQYPNPDLFKNETELKQFSILYNALKALLKTPPNKRKIEEMREKLSEFKIPPTLSQEILNLVTNQDSLKIEPYILQTKARRPYIKGFEWRVNVTVSSNFVSRVMLPYVELKLTLSNGRLLIFEMNLQKFHLLRYSIAKLLKEMQRLETKQILQ